MSDGLTPRQQVLASYDEWAGLMRELIDATRPALAALDYESAATALEGMAKATQMVGDRVRAEADRRKAAGW